MFCIVSKAQCYNKPNIIFNSKRFRKTRVVTASVNQCENVNVIDIILAGKVIGIEKTVLCYLNEK